MAELVKGSFDLLHRPLRIKGICVVKVTKPLDIFKISLVVSSLGLFKNIKSTLGIFGVVLCNNLIMPKLKFSKSSKFAKRIIY